MQRKKSCEVGHERERTVQRRPGQLSEPDAQLETAFWRRIEMSGDGDSRVVMVHCYLAVAGASRAVGPKLDDGLGTGQDHVTRPRARNAEDTVLTKSTRRCKIEHRVYDRCACHAYPAVI